MPVQGVRSYLDCISVVCHGVRFTETCCSCPSRFSFQKDVGWGL